MEPNQLSTCNQESVHRQLVQLSQSLQRLRLAGVLCDTILVCSQGKEVMAHSVLLAASSAKLAAMLGALRDKSEANKFRIQLSNCDADAMYMVLTYVYTGRLLVPDTRHSADLLTKAAFISQKLGIDWSKAHQCLDLVSGTAARLAPSKGQGSSTPIASKETSSSASRESLTASGAGIVNSPRVESKDSNASKNVESRNNLERNDAGDVSDADTEDFVMECDNETSHNDVCNDKEQSKNSENFPSEKEHSVSGIGSIDGRAPVVRLRRVSCTDGQRKTSCVDTKTSTSPVRKAEELRVKSTRSNMRQVSVIAEHGASEASSDNSTIYTCGFCAFTANSPIEVKAHLATHNADTSQMTFVCKLCGRCLATPELLAEHCRTHEVACEVCGREVKSERHLQSHRRRMHRERPYECTHCKKRFYSNVTLVQHERCHSTDRPFTCDLCHATFRQKMHLRGHKASAHRTAPIEKRYQCITCERKFSRKHHLQRHVNSCRASDGNESWFQDKKYVT